MHTGARGDDAGGDHPRARTRADHVWTTLVQIVVHAARAAPCDFSDIARARAGASVALCARHGRLTDRGKNPKMNKPKKKLLLRTETVRSLAAEALAEAIGGAPIKDTTFTTTCPFSKTCVTK